MVAVSVGISVYDLGLQSKFRACRLEMDAASSMNFVPLREVN